MNQVRLIHEQGKLRQELYIGQHHLVIDEPIDRGGEDAGPSPGEFLAAALASCTAITLRMYAQRKNWPLENAEIFVDWYGEGEITKFIQRVKLIGPLEPTQQARLLEIANRCPIHKTLEGRIEIRTSLLSKDENHLQ